jgi:hypothetical protein
MDFLDLHLNYESVYHLFYGLPRFYHVTTQDFNFITDVDIDINSSTRHLSYGVLLVSLLSFSIFMFHLNFVGC